MTSLLRTVALLVVTLLLGACSTGGAAPTSTGQGYVGAGKELITQVSPGSRTKAPVAAGTALGSDRVVSTADYLGKVVVLNVWGSWCNPCREEAAGLQQASVKTAKVAQFIGLNSRDYDPAPAQAFVRAKGVTYPSIYDPKGEVLLAFAGTLPLSSFPSTLILDRQGRVAARISGPISKITLVDLIDDVAAGR